MKDRFLDANFPRTSDGRVYHLGIRKGEIANRILIVGPPSRAEKLSKFLDKKPKPFRLDTDRGFLTFTGRYGGVPISIAAIGMGSSSADFFIREARECLQGDMVIIRLGSCGGLAHLSVGSIAVPRASSSITRNYDYNFRNASNSADANQAYHVYRPITADEPLHAQLVSTLERQRPVDASGSMGLVDGTVVNVSCDSFYGSQGRLTSFPDHNEEVIARLIQEVEGFATLEMETFHLFHLASVWKPITRTTSSQGTEGAIPSQDRPVRTSVPEGQLSTSLPDYSSDIVHNPESRIRAAAVQMVYAQRNSLDVIEPQDSDRLEVWVGKAVLDCLTQVELPKELLHTEQGSVWEI